MASYGWQLLLLLWKNFLLHKRKWFVTIMELLLPCLFTAILITVRQKVNSRRVDRPTVWSPCPVNDLPGILYGQNLTYAPDTPLTKHVMTNLIEGFKSGGSVIGCENEEEAVQLIKSNSTDFIGAIIFSSINNSHTITNLPLNITYKIRLPYKLREGGHSSNPFINKAQWYTQLTYPTMPQVGPRESGDRCGGRPGYQREGFLALQHGVDRLFVQLAEASSDSPTVSLINITSVILRRVPYPAYLDDSFVLIIQNQLPLIIMLSFLFPALNIVKNIVYEKEKLLKESMKMMGLRGWLHWTCWFITYIILLALPVALMTAILAIKIQPHGCVVAFSDPAVIFVFLIVYAAAVIFFSFAVSSLFNSANVAAASSGILFFCCYIPYFFIQPRYHLMSTGAKLAACLIPNVAMALGGQLIGMFEGAEVGVQWSNVGQGVSVDDSLTMSHVIMMLLLDCVIYMLVAWYIETVRPGDYGVPQVWYFPVMPSYWCGTKPTIDEAPPLDNREDVSDHYRDQHPPRQLRHTREWSLGGNPDFFEAEPMGLRPGIQIRHLKKVYGSGTNSKLAVADMSLNMYENQITVLLGHNGAGKSTTMSMLTGFIPPTSGTALVNGFDIRRDIDSVRESLGLCPQHNVLFDELTVEEHLYFFAKLKGCPYSELSPEVEATLSKVHLVDKRNAKSSTLSGGMKRKLSVAIALIAGSRVVILDEPSSGLDPDARRELWTVLQSSKEGRTILLTTHFMDEADLLGDRVAIMASGVVQCCGTTLFLKAKYGAGYHMTLVKMASCDVSSIMEVIQRHVSGMRVESNISEEISICLPSEFSSSFEALFTEIEDRKTELGIVSYGASITTMEEVFLRVGNFQEMLDAIQEDKRDRYGSFEANSEGSSSASSVNLNPGDQDNDFESSISSRSDTRALFQSTLNTGLMLFTQQLFALFTKRFKHSLRNKLVSLAQLLVPLVFTIIGLTVVKTWPGPEDSPPLSLTLKPFGVNTIVYLTDPDNTTHSEDRLIEQYTSQFYGCHDCQLLNINTDPIWSKDPNYEKFMINRAEQIGIFTFFQHYIIGAELHQNKFAANRLEFIGHFNDQPYHTPGITLNALSNSLLRAANKTLRITTVNHPLPRLLQDQLQDAYTQQTTGFTVAFNLLIGMSFLASSMTLFLVREKSSKAKHLQFVSGVNPVSYWVSTFIWDMINYLIPCFFLLITFVAFGVEAFVNDGRIFYVALLFLLYGWALIPLMYLLSNIFSVPSTALVWLTMFNIVSGVATLIAVTILTVPSLDLQQLGDTLRWVFLVTLPNYAFGQAISDIYENNMFIKFCNTEIVQEMCKFGVPNPCCIGNCGSFCAQWNLNYLGWAPNGIGRMVVFLSVQGVVFFSLVLFLESDLFREIRRIISPEKLVHDIMEQIAAEDDLEPLVVEDGDVAAERAFVTNSDLDELKQNNWISAFFLPNVSVVLRQLSKCYSGFCAVDNLSCSVQPGECFGLLGINGAGKTSTFRMLTGDLDPTAGSIHVNGYNIRQDTRHVQQSLGYCPQFDALIPELTARETLVMFARLRGLSESLIPEEVESLLRKLQLGDYADRLVAGYSGGNKRKLSTALALVGSPPLICLDEPTTGMDPVARRHLWNTLARYRDSGRTLILTSHSMEECEALCTKIGIMVNGQFKCLGSCQHLKAKFGKGYTLLIQVPTNQEQGGQDNVRNVIDFVDTNFPESELKDSHQGLLHFHLNASPELTWGRVFGIMEANRTNLNAINYSVCQTTLEQVFLGFARAQRPPEETRTRGLFSSLNSCFSRCCSNCCCRCFSSTRNYGSLANETDEASASIVTV